MHTLTSSRKVAEYLALRQNGEPELPEKQPVYCQSQDSTKRSENVSTLANAIAC
jgi:hypothetical protein